MVQSNMGIRVPFFNEDQSYIVHHGDHHLSPFAPSNKKVWNYTINEWEDVLFYRIYSTPNLEKWCWEHYGPPKHQGPWYNVAGYIVMKEQTYTHWKLCE